MTEWRTPDIPPSPPTPSGWQGIGAPKNTPSDIVEKLNKEISVALVDPSMNSRIVDLGSTPFASAPTEFGKVIADDVEKWGKVVKAANIKPE